ncbi:hypothetical protein NFI96_006044 [Prochilodus magdalenae]|nr:hypothetical protein NFI96_006044 [Prochilodus magdalenae]
MKVLCRCYEEVNFLLINPLTNTARALSNPVNLVYEDLAVASGGLAIEVTEQLLANTTSIISDTSVASLVTIFQTVRDPGRAEGFSFIVDPSVKNLTFYITGNSTQFSITAPSGDYTLYSTVLSITQPLPSSFLRAVLPNPPAVRRYTDGISQSQSSDQSDGSLAVIQTVINFHMVLLKNSSQPGQWSIYIDSAQPYTLKVTGKSAIDFLFDFVELFQTPHPGYTVFKSRPPASKSTLTAGVLGRKLEHPHTVPADGAVGVEVEGHQVFWTCDNNPFILVLTTVPPHTDSLGASTETKAGLVTEDDPLPF